MIKKEPASENYLQLISELLFAVELTLINPKLMSDRTNYFLTDLFSDPQYQ